MDLTGQWYGPMRLPTLQNDFRPDLFAVRMPC
jgi:hypothetical protein